MFSEIRKYWVLTKVIEGRHLYGNDVRPYCKVQVLGRSEWTDRAFHTNNPWWNETFTFYDLDLREEDLTKEFVSFQVLNPLRFRKDAILGEFQISLSEIYLQSNHGYVNKWVELTRNRHGLEYQSGFLKISVLVLTSGEEGPDLDLNPNVRDEDIESNLLRGRGSIGKPACMIIHTYRAENLPKMDFGIADTVRHAIGRERVASIDPYLEVFFAGKTVKTKAIKSDDNPEWNETLSIEFRFPSVATKVYFALKDWDRGSRDDLVAYSSLDLSEMSSPHVNGFLPTFGPAWLNFTSQEKNGNDSAYHFRGRVLLSLKVFLHDETIPISDKLPKRLEVCGVRKRFVLYVVLLEAIFTTTKFCGHPIRFGISMGPYAGHNSWTDPQHLVTNELGYPILRFGLEKPILTVISEWEDYLYRYRASLDILKVADLLEIRLTDLKDYLKTRNSSINVAKKLILDILNQTQTDIQLVLQSLPEFLPDYLVPETELDAKLRHARIRKLVKILERVKALNAHPDTVVEELNSVAKTIKILAKEPQLSIPYMELTTMSKKKVIGRNSISVLELLKRTGIDQKDYRGKEELVLLKDEGDGRPIALLRLKCVFGLESRLKTPAHCLEERGVTVNHFAQTYENQLCFCGNWRPSGSVVCTWPAWSNIDGSTSLPKSKYNIQSDLKFVGDWFVERRHLNQNSNTDKSDIDSNQVNEEGWLYGTSFKSAVRFFPAKCDTFRRRCWRRRVFRVETESWLPEVADDTKKSILKPKSFLVYESFRQFRLLAHVYQARDLVSADSNGLSDPYLRVSVNGVCSNTKTVRESLAPVWDQTLVLDVSLPDSHDDLRMTPVLIEVFDRDFLGGGEWLGYVIVTPRVIEKDEAYYIPNLNWFKLNYSPSGRGQILAAFEMVEVGHKLMSPEGALKPEVIYIPEAIRPKMAQYCLEIIFWNVSKLKFLHFWPVLEPFLELRCGKYVIKAKLQTGNDVVPISFAKIELPREVGYWGPISMVLRDSRYFGKQPVIGAVEIENVNRFFCKVSTSTQNTRKAKRKTGSSKSSEKSVSGGRVGGILISRENEEEEHCDWWLRYEASQGNQDAKKRLKAAGQDVFQVYHSELEKQNVFNGFTDMIETFDIWRGKETKGKSKKCAEIKCAVKIYTQPQDETSLNEEPQLFQLSKSLSYFRTISEVIVRVYIISGFDLASKDNDGKADPYIVVQFGNDKKDTKDRYLSNSLNPVFGEMLELRGRLSENGELSVSIRDHDTLTRDDLIGQTVIDLESRCFTKYRATCGLAKTYRIESWRDCQKPSEILETICHLWDLPKPNYVRDSCLYIGRKKYLLEDFENRSELKIEDHPKEILASHLLNMLPLVPEHVETRFLYDPKIPDVIRGKLRMWIDIFPTCWGLPGPEIQITPRSPENYVLRVVIYNTFDVELQDRNILGDRMSDIYVKGIFSGDIQSTDVHYRSLNGQGNFNYRLVFPFTYDATEKMIVYMKRDKIWSQEETTHKTPPVLTLQVWDADILTRDDFLGQLELNLLNAWNPAKSRVWCNLSQLGFYEGQDLPNDIGLWRNMVRRIFLLFKAKKNRYQRLKSHETQINLMKMKHIRGFWPFYRKREDGKYDLTGKVEMEIDILREAEANEKPAGKGREEPNFYPRLQQPKRPETSFLWFLNPIKAFKYSLWRDHKWAIITVILLVMLVLFGLLMIYQLPQLTYVENPELALTKPLLDIETSPFFGYFGTLA